jgi:hypothetical protein
MRRRRRRRDVKGRALLEGRSNNGSRNTNKPISERRGADEFRGDGWLMPDGIHETLRARSRGMGDG